MREVDNPVGAVLGGTEGSIGDGGSGNANGADIEARDAGAGAGACVGVSGGLAVPTLLPVSLSSGGGATMDSGLEGGRLNIKDWGRDRDREDFGRGGGVGEDFKSRCEGRRFRVIAMGCTSEALFSETAGTTDGEVVEDWMMLKCFFLLSVRSCLAGEASGVSGRKEGTGEEALEPAEALCPPSWEVEASLGILFDGRIA